MPQKLKSDLIKRAYQKLRISGLTVSPTPEDEELALEQLEAMAAEFQAVNVCLNYNFTDEPDLNDELNVPLYHYNMLASNLALRIASDFAKDLPASLVSEATSTYSSSSTISAASTVRQTQYPARMPRGSGTRLNRWRRYYNVTPRTPNTCKTNNMFIGETMDFYFDFQTFLNEGETISSFTLDIDEGLTLDSSTNNDPRIDYRITATTLPVYGGFQQVKITMTTDAGRVDIRFADFNVIDPTTEGSAP